MILDAGPIIGLHELGAWKAFLERCEVVAPQLVLDDEALFHSKDAAAEHSEPMDLAADVGTGRVLVAAASLTAISRVASRFTDVIELHDGELEALALLTQDESYLGHVFCSADGAAIEGACIGAGGSLHVARGVVGHGGPGSASVVALHQGVHGASQA